jgi:hypothetical protein
MSKNTLYVRFHPAEHMGGLGELAGVTEPAAVVVRRDGTLDVYGPVDVVDQRDVGDLHPQGRHALASQS